MADDANSISFQLELKAEIAETQAEIADFREQTLRAIAHLRKLLERHLTDLIWLSAECVPSESQIRSPQSRIQVALSFLDDQKTILERGDPYSEKNDHS